MALDYEHDIMIDETALDVEWLEQAPLAIKYAKQVVELREEVRRLKELKKLTRSELILEANKYPEKCCHKQKPNANDIEAYYRSHENYLDVIDELNDAISELEFAEDIKNEISFTRKAALENLVVLHGQQYFAGPRTPRNITEERKKRSKEVAANISKKLNPKRRTRRTIKRTK